MLSSCWRSVASLCCASAAALALSVSHSQGGVAALVWPEGGVAGGRWGDSDTSAEGLAALRVVLQATHARLGITQQRLPRPCACACTHAHMRINMHITFLTTTRYRYRGAPKDGAEAGAQNKGGQRRGEEVRAGSAMVPILPILSCRAECRSAASRSATA